MPKTDGEKIVALEVNMANIDKRLVSIENSMQSLHGKFDTFSKILAENYVHKDTFEEYRKSKTLERVLWFIVGAVITGLVAVFIGERGVF